MKTISREFVAFISLGFMCGGPEMGDYGKFTADISEEENNIIDEIIASDTKGYKRNIVEEKYPTLHRKIVHAAKDLAREVLIMDGAQFEDISEEDWEQISSKDRSEAVELLTKWYPSLEPVFDIDEINVCYYLSKEEIPNDYNDMNPKS